jgi:hypothetical protein
MRSTLTLFLALACTLFVVACWTQFDPPPEPTDDDDTSVVDDDDTSVVDDDDTSPTGCVAAATISCSEAFPANNNAPGSTDSVLSYGCSGLDFTGPEYGVQWDATTTGPATVAVSGITAGQDLDLFVLNDPAGTGCDPASCVTSSNGTGQEESATFDAVAGQTYYFVVDGYSESVSNFTMSLDCDPLGDDDDAVDDDDTTPTDDDDAAPDCDDPVVIGAVVTLTDPAGALTNELSTSSPMTVNVSVANSAGNTGTTSFQYVTPCIFTWSLWFQNGDPVGAAGPTCPGSLTAQDYTCGAPPVVGTDTINPVIGVGNNSGDPVPAGTYDLVVDTLYFGTFNFVVSVP